MVIKVERKVFEGKKKVYVKGNQVEEFVFFPEELKGRRECPKILYNSSQLFSDSSWPRFSFFSINI